MYEIRRQGFAGLLHTLIPASAQNTLITTSTFPEAEKKKRRLLIVERSDIEP